MGPVTCSPSAAEVLGSSLNFTPGSLIAGIQAHGPYVVLPQWLMLRPSPAPGPFHPRPGTNCWPQIHGLWDLISWPFQLLLLRHPSTHSSCWPHSHKEFSWGLVQFLAQSELCWVASTWSLECSGGIERVVNGKIVKKRLVLHSCTCLCHQWQSPGWLSSCSFLMSY